MTLLPLADTAQLLAEAFIEPDGVLGEALGELAALGLPSGISEPLARMRGAVLPSEAQAVEYARLFLHARDTDSVHLFESVQARGHHMAPEILAPLTALYDAADLTPQEDLGIPPDHLGLELACLGHLLDQLAEEGPAASGPTRGLALRLLRDHLRPFTAVVAEQLAQLQPHAYYQAAVDLAVALVDAAEKAVAEI